MADDVRLKQFYGQWVEAQKRSWLGNWHTAYKARYADVDAMRRKLNAGYRLSPVHDRDFLLGLIKEKSNGIASRGQSILRHDVLNALIADGDFLEALATLVKEPDNRHNFCALKAVWNRICVAYGARKTPLLVNRVAAACTLNLSSTVSEKCFWHVCAWLVAQHLIDPLPRLAVRPEKDWFIANISLMETLHAVFAEELKSGKTDRYWLSIFVWAIYERI